MRHSLRTGLILGATIIGLAATQRVYAQADDPNSAPNPYTMEENWAKLPAGRTMGAPIGIEVDRDGKSIWVFDRCGANNCEGSKVAPIMKFDPTGNMVANFGANMFNFPHGLGIDHQGNVYVTDERPMNGKGSVMVKFSPAGRPVFTYGRAGMPGNILNMLDGPSDVVIAPNGDMFIADGHGGTTNDRIVKLSAAGKFIKAWGKHGKAEGEFDTPHGITMDSTGRIFVADRVNSRIQIFDQDGKFIAEWKQFGRPSSVFIDKHDVLYVADSQSNAQRNPGFKAGIRVGSAKDGKVTAFIPEAAPGIGDPEELTVDDQGIIYAGYTNKMVLRRFVKK